LAGLGLLLTSVAASAEDVSASDIETFGDLVTVCGRTDDPVSMAFCHGFILGNGRLYIALRRAGAVDRWACADPIPTLQEISTAVRAWAAANPQRAGEDAVDGLWRAAAAIYPCS
jgi:hypothetical protein